MKRMIVSTAKGYTQQFCVECTDTSPDLREHLEQNLDYVEMAALVLDEVCDACGRPIRDIPAYNRLYLLKPELSIALTAEIPAWSALEARLLLHKGIEGETLLKLLQHRIGSALAEGDLLYDPGALTYRAPEPQVLPPPKDEWVTDLPTRIPVASPPATLDDLCELASVQALLDRYLRSDLDGRYTGSFERCLILHQLLAQANVQHSMMQGYLSSELGTAHPHVWIDLSPTLGPGWVVDYCARSRFGQEAPMGLFTKKDYPSFSYYGVQSPLPLDPPKSLVQDIEEALREQALA